MLKKATSGILLVLFLANMLGYYGIYLGARLHTQLQISQQLERDDLRGFESVTFRIPIALPYKTDSRVFERASGEFTYEGEVYRLVKQQLVHDTLEIVCVRDIRSKSIDQALADYVRTFTDQPEAGAKGPSKIFSQLIKDFLSETVALSAGQAGWSIDLGDARPLAVQPSAELSCEYNPPEAA
ncbi:MAG: hypothetical protein U0V64_02055 [Cyclobacteriaceae bacterium]